MAVAFLESRGRGNIHHGDTEKNGAEVSNPTLHKKLEGHGH
jgi:hypothetical protein